MILIALLSAGCSKTATIYTKDGAAIAGKIERSDASSIFYLPVKECEHKKVGIKRVCFAEETVLSRSDVRDIDHPGDVLFIASTSVAGALLLTSAVGIYFWVENDRSRENDGDSKYAIGGYGAELIALPSLALAAVSAVPAILGWVTWSDSKSASNTAKDPTEPEIRPVALTDGEKTYWGLGIYWIW